MLGTSSTAGCLALVEHTKQAQNPLGLDVIYIWVIGVILSVINISLCFLDLTLVVFHTYLCIRQITTYEYITGKVSKRKKEQKEKNKERSFREPERGSAHYVPHPPHPPRALPTFNASPYAAAMPRQTAQESQEEFLCRLGRLCRFVLTRVRRRSGVARGKRLPQLCRPRR